MTSANGRCRVYRRNGQFFVFADGSLVERTWQASWALYRYACVMGNPAPVVLPALIARDQSTKGPA